MEKILFTSESVSEGHPDKICDQISDAILDACLSIDEHAHVACECYITTNYVLVGGEITCSRHPNYEYIVRDTLKRIGYTSSDIGIDCNKCIVDIKIHQQSPDIAQGVVRGEIFQQGAGDQGIMFGYASDESEGFMPLGIVIAHKLVRLASMLRKNGSFLDARPDMKSQVTIDYTDPERIRIDTILMSVQHSPNYNEKEFKSFIVNSIMKPVAESFGLNTDFVALINPTGRFSIGGPAGDTGLTGRKIIVDTYGGWGAHGGGAFSGKDSSKVDRSAAYAARWIAKSLVHAGLCERCLIQLSYAIGVNHPLSIHVDTYGTGKKTEAELVQIINKNFDLRPGCIIRELGLDKPVFKETASYGHFGREGFAWEQCKELEL